MDDIWSEILGFTAYGSDFKALARTNKKINQIINELFPDASISFANQLLTLIKLYPNAPWNYANLSANPNLTWEFVRSRLDDPATKWDWKALSENPCITWEIMHNNSYVVKATGEKITLPWYWNLAMTKPDITWELIQSQPDYIDAAGICRKTPWCWDKLTLNPNITLDHILTNMDKPWSIPEITLKKNLTLLDIQKLTPAMQDFSYTSLWGSALITLEDLYNNSNKFSKIDWHGVLCNPNITWEFIRAYIDILSPCIGWWIQHPCITLRVIEDNPDLPWTWDCLLANPNLTWDFILKSLKRVDSAGVYLCQQHERELIVHPCITWDIILAGPTYINAAGNKITIIWAKIGFLENPNINWKIIHENPELQDWDLISCYC